MIHFENMIRKLARPFISASLGVTLVATSVQAAVLSDLEGAVSVNRGYGFQPGSIGSSLAPGDRVRVDNGFAFVQYDNGCTTRVAPGQVAVVYAEPPVCGVAAPAEPQLNPLLVGGLVVEAAAGLAIALSSNESSDSRPVGP